MNQTRQYAIVTTTYSRPDGKTPFFLKRAIDSALGQTYQNFKMYVVGDKYEPDAEFAALTRGSDKILAVNLPVAKEREKYTGEILWAYGGVNAMNHGVQMALDAGLDYVFHLDHDDWWRNDHIQLVHDCIEKTNAVWVCTKANSLDGTRKFPYFTSALKHVYFVPKPNIVVHSSVCMNFRKLPLMYVDVMEATGQPGLAADADLWRRVGKHLTQNNMMSFCVNEHTCYRDTAGHTKQLNTNGNL